MGYQFPRAAKSHTMAASALPTFMQLLTSADLITEGEEIEDFTFTPTQLTRLRDTINDILGATPAKKIAIKHKPTSPASASAEPKPKKARSPPKPATGIQESTGVSRAAAYISIVMRNISKDQSETLKSSDVYTDWVAAKKAEAGDKRTKTDTRTFIQGLLGRDKSVKTADPTDPYRNCPNRHQLTELIGPMVFTCPDDAELCEEADFPDVADFVQAAIEANVSTKMETGSASSSS